VKARYNSLVAINFRGFATTNIDEQIRAAFARVGRPLDFVVSWADTFGNVSLIRDLLSNYKDWIFQLHGERFHPDDCVLGEDDYTKVWGSRAGTQYKEVVGPMFMDDLTSKPACFLGFSFDDDRMFKRQDVKSRRSSASAPWFAVISDSAIRTIEKTLEDLQITPIIFANRDGNYYELDNLLRNLSYLARADTLRGTEEAAFRGAGYVLQDGEINDRGLVQQFKAGEPLHFARIDLKCKMFPNEFWVDDWYGQKREESIFRDEGEAQNQIRIMKPDAGPPVSREQLLRELEHVAVESSNDEHRAQAVSVLKRLTSGQNAYPRLAGPIEVKDLEGIRTLLLTVADSTYGLALVAEKNLPIASLEKLRQLNLNSLAVRIAYTYRDKDNRYCLFQQRRKEENATYEEAWDVAAAGYIDPSRHEQLGHLSPWLAAARELEEEPRIRREYLPYPDNYEFFGVVRNEDSGQLDILGECKGIFYADWATHEHGLTVERLEACELSSASIAAFIRRKEWWVPTAILTTILVLEGNFSRTEIEQAFAEAEVWKHVYLEKHRRSVARV